MVEEHTAVNESTEDKKDSLFYIGLPVILFISVSSIVIAAVYGAVRAIFGG